MTFWISESTRSNLQEEIARSRIDRSIDLTTTLYKKKKKNVFFFFASGITKNEKALVWTLGKNEKYTKRFNIPVGESKRRER